MYTSKDVKRPPKHFFFSMTANCYTCNLAELGCIIQGIRIWCCIYDALSQSQLMSMGPHLLPSADFESGLLHTDKGKAEGGLEFSF